MNNLSRVQLEFAEHIRQPEMPDADEEVQRRLAVYRDLFFNNVKGFLQNGFPVIRNVLPPEVFDDLARAFFHHHPSRSPIFTEIGKEFVEFLSRAELTEPPYPVWLASLAHYEWIELDVSIRRGESLAPCGDNVTAEKFVSLSPLASLVAYDYPVHQISTSFQPVDADGPHYYLIYRTTGDQVKFKVLSQATALVVQIIEQAGEPLKVSQLLSELLSMMPQATESGLAEALTDMLAQLAREGIIGIS